MAVSAEWLQSQLRKPNSMDFLLILDCRLQSDFIESHIKVRHDYNNAHVIRVYTKAKKNFELNSKKKAWDSNK